MYRAELHFSLSSCAESSVKFFVKESAKTEKKRWRWKQRISSSIISLLQNIFAGVCTAFQAIKTQKIRIKSQRERKVSSSVNSFDASLSRTIHNLASSFVMINLTSNALTSSPATKNWNETVLTSSLLAPDFHNIFCKSHLRFENKEEWKVTRKMSFCVFDKNP